MGDSEWVVEIIMWGEKFLLFVIAMCLLILAVGGSVCLLAFISLNIGGREGAVWGPFHHEGSAGGNGLTARLRCSHGGPRPGAL